MTSRFIMPTADVGSGLKPSDGAKLSFFETGTSTPKNTFSDSAGTIPNTNPVIADSVGVFPDIFIAGTYKVTLTDKNNVQAGFGEADPVKETVTTDSVNFVEFTDLSADSGSSLIGYDNGGISAVARTVEVKLRDVIHVKDFGATGDGSTNDGQAFVDADAAATALGGADIHIGDGTYVISSLFTLGVGNGLIGEYRANSVIKQTNTSVGGVKLSGVNRVKDIRIEAPTGNTDILTIGLDASGTADNIVEQVRILDFGFGVKSTGLTWRQSYTHVRVENPRNAGFHFEEANIHLEIYLNQCYVVNTSTFGVTNKTSYFISGSQGTTMILCTSDGGDTVTRENLGANIINSRVVMINSHWEGYKAPTGFISGAEFNGIVRSSGSRLSMDGARFQNCTPSTASSAALIYGENSGSLALTGIDPNTNTLAAYTTQHIGVSNDFGKNQCAVASSDDDLILKEAGNNAGTAHFYREGVEDKRVSDTVTFTVNVNKIKSIVFAGSTGDLTDLTDQHSDGQQVRIVHRVIGVVVKNNARLRLQAAADFTATVNSMQIFEYSSEGDFWSEISHVI